MVGDDDGGAIVGSPLINRHDTTERIPTAQPVSTRALQVTAETIFTFTEV